MTSAEVRAFPEQKWKIILICMSHFLNWLKKKYDIKKKSLLLLGKTNQSINEIKFLISIY